MTRPRRVFGRGRPRRWLVFALVALSAAPVYAEKFILADGRVLDGRFAKIPGVANNPLANGGAAAANQVNVILMCDDDLRRTMVAQREVAKYLNDPPPRIEHFFIKDQSVADTGAPIASLGAIVWESTWDKFGRRTVKVQIGGGVQAVIQGLTEITPTWSKAETLNGGAKLLWDMRIATSSIPRDLLSKVLMRQIDPKDPDQRLKLVRFYMQAERFTEAEAELQQVIADFKNLPNLPGLKQTALDLRRLSGEKALREIGVRMKAGQLGLAENMLRVFPVVNMPGAILQDVREKLEQNERIAERREGVITKLDEQLGKVKDAEIKKAVKPLRDEIDDDLRVATLDRMAPFLQFADDGDMLPEQKLALAISGWLVGANDTTENLQLALSLVETRAIIRKYLTKDQRIDLDPLVSSLGSQQGASEKYVAEIIAHMKPPLAPEPDPSGFYKLQTQGLQGDAAVTYFVQLPPEYNPYVKYPTIITLNAAGTTPEQQIDWWAGVSEAAAMRAAAEAAEAQKAIDEAKDAGQKKAGANVEKSPAKDEDKPAGGQQAQPAPAPRGGFIDPSMRRGQAARQGYIVIAPVWAKPHQMSYEYSAREHAAVLKSLTHAMKQFSIDTDRVFLSGHSMGGDAAWDIGLAHPDLWAGVIPIVATSGKYVPLYWPNAERVPFYFVGGELDGNKTVTNGPQLDRYFGKTAKDHELWDVTYVEYQGRGHEHFSDEILRIFDWMGRKHRDFFPKQFKAVTMRTWDNYFWCVELNNMPAAQMIDPTAWPPPRSTLPFNVEFRENGNVISVPVRNAKVTLWLSPEMVDFNRSIEVTIGGSRVATPRGVIKPSVAVILDDVRLRGDRQHPFWAKIER